MNKNKSIFFVVKKVWIAKKYTWEKQISLLVTFNTFYKQKKGKYKRSFLKYLTWHFQKQYQIRGITFFTCQKCLIFLAI